MQHDIRDAECLGFLETKSQIPRCGLCGKTLRNAQTDWTNQGSAHCSACKRAARELRKVEEKLRELPKDAADFDRSKLARERNARKQVLESRKGDGEKLNEIFNPSPTSAADLEEDFNCIGRCIGRKKNLYGGCATQFGHLF